MKKRTLFILVGILILALLISLIWWLSVREVKINDNHVGINFEIHNCPAVEKDQKLMHEKFLKPLLQFFMVEESNGREQLFIPKITCNEVSFCIPVFGMNSLRYKNDASNINETTITSTSRKDDEETFFSKWTAEGFNDLETILSKGNAKNLKNQNLPSLSTLRLKDASDDIIQDSIIIDKSCIAEQSPYLFNSAENARKYINSVLSKNPNALIKGTKNKTIHLFIWCGNGYLLNANDIDNDGVSNEKDSCPNVPGEKSNNGCPKKVDSDGDGFNDDVDQCKDIPGECDGCECKPPPPGCPDKDRDGICNNEDKCPNNYGFTRYGGCPIPDTDKDGVNDEKDNCKYDPGPISNNGCPVVETTLEPTIEIKLEGTAFKIIGVTIDREYTAKLTAKGKREKVINFTGNKCPANTVESKSMALQIDSDDLTITIVVYKNEKEVKRVVFNNMSFLCFKNKDCGFTKI